MNKEFIPYEQALELKELGFDELCFSYYKNDQFSDILEEVINSEMRNVNNEIDDYISAPLYQQAFRWFRENHGLIGWVEGKFKYKYCIESIIPTDEQLNGFPFRKHEEAELSCLKQLIEMVKLKQYKNCND